MVMVIVTYILQSFSRCKTKLKALEWKTAVSDFVHCLKQLGGGPAIQGNGCGGEAFGKR